jgi:AcrR family transcriptional regulator
MVTPKRKDAQQLTELILETARDLFTQYGVDTVSMHQIAKTAGVGQATMYRRYAQKGDLCLDLIDDQFNRLRIEIEGLLEQLAGTPILERLIAVFRRIIMFTHNEASLLKAIHVSLVQSRCLNADAQQFFCSQPYLFLHGTLASLLKEALDAGLTVPFEPAFTAHIMIAALAPHTLQHLSDCYGYTTDDIIDQLVQTLIRPLFISVD